ncbi:AAA family ATPase [Lentilactobacillus sp. Marseille-Q4993]|uniref:AAA family ATPase n=1 Tax=Lentilactobacillus sp. Marseille-Q4993 TaxID=3039492 RepID=UPI0024BD11B9|nr:AAA family ATPase [Lentilactobacillus sp. Marseille-Q4993]
MRITKLNIYGFGKWVDQSFDIDDHLQIVTGANEAGKTTIIEFIKSVFFGFLDKRQARHGQYVPKETSSYGGEIEFTHDGKHYRVKRTELTKGGKVELFDLDSDTQLTREDFETLISPMDRQTFDNLYYFSKFNEDSFYKLSEEELRQQIQQVGVIGADKLFALSKDYEKQASAYYLPRGRKQVIIKQLHEYDDLAARVDDAKNNFGEYQELSSRELELQTSKKQIDDKLKKVQTNHQQLSDQAGVIPLINSLNELPKYTEADFREGFQQADMEKMTALRTEVSHTSTEVENSRQKLAGMTVEETPAAKFYNQNQDQIVQLLDKLPSVEQQANRVDYLNSDVAQLTEQRGQILSELNLGETSPAPIAFNNDDINRVNQLLNQRELAKQAEERKRSQPEPDVKPAKTVKSPILLGVGAVALILGIVMTKWWLAGIALVPIIAAFLIEFPSQPEQQAEPQNVEPEIDLGSVERQLAEIREQYHLDSIPAEEWIQAQSSISRLKDTTAKLQQTRTDAEQTVNGVIEYLNQWQFAADWIPMKKTTSSLTSDLDGIKSRTNKWHDESIKVQEQKKQLVDRQTSLSEKTDRLKKLQQQLSQFLADRQLVKEADFQTVYEEQNKIHNVVNQRQMLEQRIKSTNVVVPKDARLEEIQAKMNEDKIEISKLQSESHQVDSELTNTGIRIKQLIKNGEYHDLRQQQANLKSEILDSVSRYVALSLSQKFIIKVLDIASKGRLPRVLNDAQKYFAILTNHNYKEIKFGDKKITVTRSDNTKFEINELSRGTLAQLYMALVLALAINFSDQYPMPMIIDDGFVDFDQSRTKAAYELISELAKSTQVLYFTTRTIENEFTQQTLNLDELQEEN